MIDFHSRSKPRIPLSGTSAGRQIIGRVTPAFRRLRTSTSMAPRHIGGQGYMGSANRSKSTASTAASSAESFHSVSSASSFVHGGTGAGGLHGGIIGSLRSGSVSSSSSGVPPITGASSVRAKGTKTRFATDMASGVGMITGASLATIDEGSGSATEVGISGGGGTSLSGGAGSTDLPTQAVVGGAQTKTAVQVGEDTVKSIYNQDIIEATGPVNDVDLETPIESNYDVESIKSWLGRQAHVASFDGSTRTLFNIDRPFLEQVAKHKLDYFQYFRGDLVLTMRWNFPQTVFGAYLFTFAPGNGPSMGDPNFSQKDYADATVVKVLADAQSSVATLHIPWMYFYAFWDRSMSSGLRAQIGQFISVPIIPVASVSELVPNQTILLYAQWVNVSLLTPMCLPVAQGPLLALLPILAGAAVGIGAGVASGEISNAIHKDDNNNNYETQGSNAMRIFNEGLNLMRQDGIDPAPPCARTTPFLKPTGDTFAVTSFEDYGVISTYHEPIGGTLVVPSSHYWFKRIWAAHAYVRADFGVRLHCFATPWHSGRLRVTYISDQDNASVLPPGDLPDSSYGPSVVWDIQDDKTIDLVVPYGHPLEYGKFPALSIVVENDFTTSLGLDVPPQLMAEVVFTNLHIMGFKMPAVNPNFLGPLPYRTMARYTPTSIPNPEGTEVAGWYNPIHTSEDEFNTLIKTTARRPCHYALQSGAVADFPISGGTGGIWPVPSDMGDLVHVRGPIVPFIQRAAGWRGSVKVSVVLADASLSVKLAPIFIGSGSSVSNVGYVVTGAGFGEIVLPYMSPDLFYARGVSYPVAVRIFASGDTTFNLWFSFLDDFELLWPIYQYDSPNSLALADQSEKPIPSKEDVIGSSLVAPGDGVANTKINAPAF